MLMEAIRLRKDAWSVAAPKAAIESPHQAPGDLMDPPVVFLPGHSHLAGGDRHLELVLVVDEPGLDTRSDRWGRCL